MEQINLSCELERRSPSQHQSKGEDACASSPFALSADLPRHGVDRLRLLESALQLGIWKRRQDALDRRGSFGRERVISFDRQWIGELRSDPTRGGLTQLVKTCSAHPSR